MAVFSYVAIDAASTDVRGTLAADTPRQARDELRALGLVVRELDEQRSDAGRRLFSPRRAGSAADMAATVRELSTLLAVGIPLLEALDVMRHQCRGRLKASLLRLRDRVAGGAALAEAMAEQPEVFDALSIRLVEVGENAGTLDVVLSRLADFKEQSLQLRDRVTTALLYPLVVLAAAAIVSGFLMTVVVPMLLESLLEAGRPLPWPTRLLKAISDLLLGQGLWMLMILLALAAAGAYALRTPSGRRAWHKTLLRLPIAGELARKQAVGRLAMVLAVLLRSGIEFLKAAEIAGRTTTNVIIREALEQSAVSVADGADLGPALDRSGAFSPVVVRLFTVGQQTGCLEEMLERLATDSERQVAAAAARLAAILEPVLILGLSVVVGFILFATILPILEAGNVL